MSEETKKQAVPDGKTEPAPETQAPKAESEPAEKQAEPAKDQPAEPKTDKEKKEWFSNNSK